MKRLILVAMLVSCVCGELRCRDYIPRNWTAPAARILIASDHSISEPFLPTYVDVGNPWQLAPKDARAAQFHLKTCNDAGLGIRSSTNSWCNDDGTGCGMDYNDYVQVINPKTGHCLTAKNKSTSVAELIFAECIMRPRDVSQLWWAYQSVLMVEKCCFEPGAVYDWGIVVGLQPPNSRSPSHWKYWHIGRDNRTIQQVSGYPESYLYMTLKHVDPLRSG